ncbi:MAG: hypothetical protein KAQ92_07810, partial [Candidatus Aenigmarchaeota archaeon]|nr:hypothetical protein [Candidatus Aenigmarchaeota archaeon]
MKMKNRRLAILVLLCLITCFTSISYAIPSIDITKFEIQDEIFVGDVLDVAVDFAVISDRPELVRISLYIDNRIKDTYSSFYPDGDFTFTFHYDTDYISRGRHDLKIKAEIIRDDNVKDTDFQTQTFELKAIVSTIYHDVQISEIKYPLKASLNSKIPIILTIENKGIVDESSMQTEIKLNGVVYKSDYFYLQKGSEKIQTMYVQTPMGKGEYEIEIQTKNPYVMDEEEIILNVEPISLILKADKVNISEGKYVFVYGYVREEKPRQTYVYLYKDNVFFTKLMPEGDGYFSAFLKFDEAGEHIITAKIYGLRKYIKINAYEIEKEEIINETVLHPEPIEETTTGENETIGLNETFPVDITISNETIIDESKYDQTNKTSIIDSYFVKTIKNVNILSLFVLLLSLLFLHHIFYGKHILSTLPWIESTFGRKPDEGELKTDEIKQSLMPER